MLVISYAGLFSKTRTQELHSSTFFWSSTTQIMNVIVNVCQCWVSKPKRPQHWCLPYGYRSKQQILSEEFVKIKYQLKIWCPFSHPYVFCCITYSSNWYKPALLYFSHVLNPRYDRQQVLTGRDFKILAKSHNRTHITIQMTSPPREKTWSSQ